MSKDILVHDMNSSKAYDEEIKLTRTEIVKLMTEAKESVMTVKFHKKVDEDHVKSTLMKIKSKENIGNDKFLKQLSKELILGGEVNMVCTLTRSEGKLGRSSVADLNAKFGFNFRQIDHRTVQELILQNKKYVVK
jgi:hypothetical protein